MMNSKQAAIVKGVGVGMAVVGGALGIAAAVKKPGYARSAKRGFNKALKTFSSIVNAIS